jgi:alpha-L-rhamnosidase
LQEMRRRWGQMVRESDDTGTLWEMFNGSESCHNYGAVPAYFLSSYVLGVRLDGPVWNKRLVIEPRLGELAHAEGVVVTELGPLSVSWRRHGMDLSFRFEVPKGARAMLRIPEAAGPTLTLDGRQARAAMQGRHATLVLKPGVHEGRIAVKLPIAPAPEARVGEPPLSSKAAPLAVITRTIGLSQP